MRTESKLATAVNETLKVNQITDGYIRLVVTRGAGTLGLDPNKTSDPQVIRVVDLTRLRVTFYVPTAATHKLVKNDSVHLRFPETGAAALGRIDYVGAVTEADSGLVRVDVLIDNPAGKHRSGVRCLLELTHPVRLTGRIQIGGRARL